MVGSEQAFKSLVENLRGRKGGGLLFSSGTPGREGPAWIGSCRAATLAGAGGGMGLAHAAAKGRLGS